MSTALLSALGGGVYGYNKHRKADPGKAVADALKLRAALRASQNPPELQILPQDLGQDDEDDEETQPRKMKLAANDRNPSRAGSSDWVGSLLGPGLVGTVPAAFRFA